MGGQLTFDALKEMVDKFETVLLDGFSAEFIQKYGRDTALAIATAQPVGTDVLGGKCYVSTYVKPGRLIVVGDRQIYIVERDEGFAVRPLTPVEP